MARGVQPAIQRLSVRWIGVILGLPAGGGAALVSLVLRPPLLLLFCALAVALAFTGWRLTRPYDPVADPAAAYRIKSAVLTEDHGYCWLAIELEAGARKPAAMAASVLLECGEDQRVEPATLGAPLRPGAPGPSLRFWLRATQLSAPLTLVIGGDRLRVKLAGPAPKLAEGQTMTLRQTRW